ncbi:META domain-containing protein [Halomonas llamarensis]|uniref:META domain-containing protein n=1 Tax=Halomonas llamarensis TaxID=2945104 RepID=A0ABT0SNN8_9GAMM|nr:META domain-containing protein [Halomonas llamarensis]MCL7929402.1 META domain-containing protein [Halomonas llamarensis]
MTIKNWRLLPWLASATLLLSACSSAPGPGSATDPEPVGGSLSGPVIEQRWNFLLNGTNEKLDFDQTPYFRIASDGSVSGYDGCNRFTGQVELGANQRIAFNQLASTRMACPGMENAQHVTNMLTNAYRYLIDHDRLVFFGPDSRVLGGWREAD